jgi:iron complex outermembrane receptor protein
MCGQNPTGSVKHASRIFTALAGGAALLFGPGASAQEEFEGILDEIVITAQKREESLQEVPISVATLQGDRLDVLFSGSEDILALSGRVPGLYAESSNGRAAPRFYLRGLGNIDFDLAASQPVSIVMDEVVLENTVLKSFPLFDVGNIEVIRGPQGTLFGRNTIAGIIKVNTRRPEQDFSGYVRGSYATHATTNLEGAFGGALIEDTLSTRVSFLARTRDNWITNAHTGRKSLGKYDEYAGRAQLLWTPSENFSGLLSFQLRNLNGTSSIFRANVFTPGSAELNQNYQRDVVYYDGGDDNPQGYNGNGTTLNLEWDLSNVVINSITSYQQATGFSRGDIDGGVANIGTTPTPPPGITWADVNVLCPFPCLPARTWPGPIFTPSVTQDGADTDQFTQEFRIASDTTGPLSWQVGAFYFDSSLEVTTENFASEGFVSAQDTKIQQDNTTWAVFGQLSYDITDRLNVAAGARYTDDDKDFRVIDFAQLWIDLNSPILSTDPINSSDDNTSYEVSLNFAATENSSLYGRYASGFRAQTIQGRDVAFEESPSVADSETIDSFEIGYKSDFWSNKARINVAAFMYEVNDMQFSVIGGSSNVNQVINADKGEAQGIEIDADFLISEGLLVTAGFAFNDTEIKDSSLATAPCGSGLCTPLDALEDPNDPNNPKVLIGGNPFPRAPETTFNFSLRYSMPVGNSAEIYFFTDWAWWGEINMPLYEAIEFRTNNQFEGGLRIGYENFDSGWHAALFGRNITNESNTLGFIDFSNNTGFVNEPRIWGIEVGYDFGD